MTALTKTDIAAFRAADVLCVHLHAERPTGLVRLIKRADRNKAFAEDIEHIVNAPVVLDDWRNREAIANGAKCFAHIGFYHEQNTPAGTIARLLKVGDEITFRFAPDHETNGNTTKARLHGDVLYLDVKRPAVGEARNSKRFVFVLDTSICPDNSARMCSDVPMPHSWNEADSRVA